LERLSIPIPSPCFLDECEYIGAKYSSGRWRSHGGKRLYEWDYTHGHIEVYDKRGHHIYVADAQGNYLKGPKPGRKINV
jgi:hypothetical protein